MKYLRLLCFAFLSISSFAQENSNTVSNAVKDNEELKELYKKDQADRQGIINWQEVSKKDSLRRVRVYELLESKMVKTSLDYSNAAMIFQHGNDTISSGMAVKLMRKAIKLDSTANKWLLAAAIDRDLMRKGEPQIYGTQYIKMGVNKPYELYKLDSTKVSDAERREYGVETLAEQKLKLKMLNKKKLPQLFASGKSIDKIVEFCKSENLIESEYDLSENSINGFGYQLMSTGKNQEALKIFKLNTELYPNGFNTYDSYGECLLKLGDKEGAIKAYRKSLELNPNNKNAANMLSNIE